MRHSENPQEFFTPEYRNPGQVVLSYMKKIGGVLRAAFQEDPAVRKTIEDTLTPEFLERFLREFTRMKEESRSGAGSIARILQVSGFGHESAMFNVVLREMLPKAMKDLPPAHYAEVVQRLSDYCGMPAVY